MNLRYKGDHLDFFGIVLLQQKNMFVIVRVNKNVCSQPVLVFYVKKVS